MGVKAEPSPAGSTAKRALWAGRKTSRMKVLAASAVVIPASLIPGSGRGRSCNVWKARSERPLAKGVRKDARLSTGYAVRKPR
jgi:hypothetical protein